MTHYRIIVSVLFSVIAFFYYKRYLRREKEFAEAQKQILEAENQRLKQQLTMKIREVDEARTALSDEQARIQVTIIK